MIEVDEENRVITAPDDMDPYDFYSFLKEAWYEKLIMYPFPVVVYGGEKVGNGIWVIRYMVENCAPKEVPFWKIHYRTMSSAGRVVMDRRDLQDA